VSVKPLTAVVAALPEEAAALMRRLTGAAQIGTPAPPLRSLHVGSLADGPVAVAVTGDGERNARAGIRRLFETVPVRRVVVIGIAGGLDPGLDPGALIVGGAVCTGDATFRIPALLIDLARQATGARAGVVLTARDLLDSPASKAQFRARCAHNGLKAGAVADLESAFYAEAAQGANIPWIVLRAVSDAASEALPVFLNRCRDEGGSIVRTAVAREALVRSAAIPSLLRLRHRVSRCSAILADAVERLLQHWDADDVRS
jgi:adenosylhomocysteine nucleosidase